MGYSRSESVMAMAELHNKINEAAAESSAVEKHTPQAPVSGLRQRNRMFAALLASVATLVFVIAISLAVLIHYAEVHHILAQL
jgi:hypothetical protein